MRQTATTAERANGNRPIANRQSPIVNSVGNRQPDRQSPNQSTAHNPIENRKFNRQLTIRRSPFSNRQFNLQSAIGNRQFRRLLS
jgi:hypothetical protein